MPSSTAPTHGKYGALYLLRPNNYKGVTASTGLNDVTWGLGYNGADNALYEVMIDHAGVPDSFKWRKDGGAWTEDVALTGAPQTLDEAQQITFAATTGHTVGDQWAIGNLKAEPCTEATPTAQITEATHRWLNPNRPPVWTDAGGGTFLSQNYLTGTGTFTAVAGQVSVTGNNGYIPKDASLLQKVAYVQDWSLTLNLDMAEISAMGDAWKTYLPGMAGGSGSFNAYFVSNKTPMNNVTKTITGGEKYYLLRLFTWDLSQDETGDGLIAWVSFPSWSISAAMNAVVRETVNFQIEGGVSFIADT